MSSSDGGSFAHRIRLSVNLSSLPLSPSGSSEVDLPFLERGFFDVLSTDSWFFDPVRLLRGDRPAGDLLESCKLTPQLAAGEPAEDHVELI